MMTIPLVLPRGKNGLFPIRFADYFSRDSLSSNSYRLRITVRRDSTNIQTRLQSTEKSIQIRGEKLWTDIPEDERAISTISCFKKMIKRMLIENYV